MMRASRIDPKLAFSRDNGPAHHANMGIGRATSVKNRMEGILICCESIA